MTPEPTHAKIDDYDVVLNDNDTFSDLRGTTLHHRDGTVYDLALLWELTPTDIRKRVIISMP